MMADREVFLEQEYVDRPDGVWMRFSIGGATLYEYRLLQNRASLDMALLNSRSGRTIVLGDAK
jgi:hypothetical protein